MYTIQEALAAFAIAFIIGYLLQRMYGKKPKKDEWQDWPVDNEE